jgi:hypothetical protein
VLDCLPHAFTLISYSAYSSTLKIEAICSSETPVDFERTTQRCIPEDRTLHKLFLTSCNSNLSTHATCNVRK